MLIRSTDIVFNQPLGWKTSHKPIWDQQTWWHFLAPTTMTVCWELPMWALSVAAMTGIRCQSTTGQTGNPQQDSSSPMSWVMGVFLEFMNVLVECWVTDKISLLTQGTILAWTTTPKGATGAADPVPTSWCHLLAMRTRGRAAAGPTSRWACPMGAPYQPQLIIS